MTWTGSFFIQLRRMSFNLATSKTASICSQAICQNQINITVERVLA